MDAREDGESTKLPTAGCAWRDAVYAARAPQTHARGQRERTRYAQNSNVQVHPLGSSLALPAPGSVAVVGGGTATHVSRQWTEGAPSVQRAFS